MTVRAITLDAPTDTAFPTAEFITVTPGLAQEWLGRNEGNRNLKHLKIATLVRDILADRFLITGEAIKFDWNGRLIDGQNRLHAVVKASRPVTLLVVRGLDPESQKVMDTGAKRSAGDALRMAGHHNQQNVLAATIRLLIAWDKGELTTAFSKAPEVTHSEVLDFYATNDDLDAAVAQATKIYKKIKATPSPLATAIYLTTLVDAEDSYRFFQELGDLDLGGKGNPKATLYTRLETLKGEKYTAAQQLYFILRAWNAWREGKSLTGMKDRVASGASKMPEPK